MSTGNPVTYRRARPELPASTICARFVSDYGKAARNAKEAGFDGAEVHGANGYLFDQFLNSVVNERYDEYGRQSRETRTRLLLEAFDAVAAVFGSERVGVRIAPYGNFGDMKPDPKTEETFFYLAEQLTKRGAAYVHIVRGSQDDEEPVVPEPFFTAFRNLFKGTVIITGGLTKSIAETLLQKNIADLFGFGQLFISNPDLPERFEHDWPLAPPDKSTFYGGGARGYTDYPTFTSTH